MVRGVLFDFDLTLAESSRGTVECATYALGKLGLPSAAEDAIRRTIGLSLEETFRVLTRNADPAAAKGFAALFVARADEVMVSLTSLFPEAAPTLSQLRRRGPKTGVVSTKYRYRIEGILRRDGLLSAFDAIVGREDVSLPKPHPEGIERALHAIGVAPAEAVFVGDHPVDARAASAAGVRFVAVLTGTSAATDFRELPVAGFARSLVNLPRLVRRL